MYSVDTSHFYSNHEKYLHDMNCKYRRERNYCKNHLREVEKELIAKGYSLDEDLKEHSDICRSLSEADEESKKLIHERIELQVCIAHKAKKAKESKEKLLKLLANKVHQNEITDGKHHTRTLREQDLHDTNVISVFESFLTRTIGLEKDDFTEDLMVVQVYYFDVFKDIAFYGFKYKGEKYKYFTSSAGQIRRKKAVFIKQSVWDRIEKTIMCGLTIDKINAKGGINVNKYLAYMALANSATDEWPDFDIDRCIVVDDFEADVFGTFDYIDDVDYSIKRETGSASINHTDGAGMMLPSVMDRNTMFRIPFVKGLLGVFDFRQLILEKGWSPKIVDIYGKEWDVFEDDIRIILTASQFKMNKYYSSWQDYKDNYKKYNCKAGLCNTEEDRIKNAKINYQMLQTLTNITSEEIDTLAARSVEKITNLCSSLDSMMDALGITPYASDLSPFQQAVKIYPNLLNDSYARDIIRSIKNSLLKKYRAGKLEINGKYTFVLPDYYACCEHWFGHIEHPKGLLDDGEVFCWLYRGYDKADVLRSPHLYKEHAVRFNVANKSYGERANEIRRWFTTNGIYTSTHDLISRILQFDVDGDRLLVVVDPDFVKIAERNMNGIVPLYYEMKKAQPTHLDNKTIYEGLNAAFTHGNIGIYSNNISKIWNSEVFISGTQEEQQQAIDCVKLLCAENNYCIDSAKTLYMPTRPDWFSKIVSSFTNKKLPAFFEFAKDKTKDQIEPRNKSLVNQLYDKIPDKPVNVSRLGIGKIDYRMLMNNVNVRPDSEVIDLYNELNREYRYKINMKSEYEDNLNYIATSIRSEFDQLGYSPEMITDMLVRYLYGNNHSAKQLLWFCYGGYIVNNLKHNIEVPETKYVQCIDCGEWIEVPLRSRTCRCRSCKIKYRREQDRTYNRKSR